MEILWNAIEVQGVKAIKDFAQEVIFYKLILIIFFNSNLNFQFF